MRGFETRFYDSDFDPAEQAIVIGNPEPAECQPNRRADRKGRLEGVQRSGDWVRAVVHSSGCSLLVFLETRYPGWQVRVDGELADLDLGQWFIHGGVSAPRPPYRPVRLSALAMEGGNGHVP